MSPEPEAGAGSLTVAQGYRPDRVGDQIREELSAMLARGEVHDPDIGFITLTTREDVAGPAAGTRRTTRRSATPPRGRRPPPRWTAPRRSCGAGSASALRLRRVPVLEFRFDESIAHQDRIEQILRDLKDEDAQRAATPATTAPPETTDRD